MMDKYMQTAKEMLVLIDEFDKEDVFDMDKTIQLDNKLRELQSDAKCLYTDTILRCHDQIMEIMQGTEIQTTPVFYEKFNINEFLCDDDSMDGEEVQQLLLDESSSIFNLNLIADIGFSDKESKKIHWSMDYDMIIEGDLMDTDPITDADVSYIIRSISSNRVISEKACFRDIDEIISILKNSSNLANIIKTRFMKSEEYDDTVLNIIAVRIYYLLHMLSALIVYGAATVANKMIDLPITAIEDKYI